MSQVGNSTFLCTFTNVTNSCITSDEVHAVEEKETVEPFRKWLNVIKHSLWEI